MSSPNAFPAPRPGARSPRTVLAPWAFGLALVLAWYAAVWVAQVPSFLLPTPHAVLLRLVANAADASVWGYIGATAAEAVGARARHLRTERGEREIDLIVVRDDHRVVAIEIKLAQAIDDRDVRHLRWLQDTIGDDLLDRGRGSPSGSDARRQSEAQRGCRRPVGGCAQGSESR